MKFSVVFVLSGLWAGAALAAPATPTASLPITVKVSDPFLMLTAEGIRSVFPAESGRPDAVVMTQDRKLSVAFEWRKGKLRPNEVEKLLTQFPAVIRKQIPAARNLKASLLPLGGRSWAQFTFTTPTKGDELRRELLMTSINNRLFVITIAANLKDYNKYSANVQKMLSEIKVIN